MELKTIWQIIWRRKWIMSQVFLVVFATIIGGSFLMTPVYETSAKLLIKSNDTESATLSAIGLQQGSKMASLGTSSDTETETHLELLTLDPILEKVIDKLQLRSKQGVLYKPFEIRSSTFLISSIFPKPNVKIRQVEDIDMIEITTRAEDNEVAAMMANTLAQFYIQENLKQRKKEYQEAREFIQSQLEKVKSDYIETLEDIKEFKIRNDIVDLGTETKLALEKMASLLEDKEETIIKIIELRARMSAFEAQRAKETAQSVSSTAINENPQIETLKRNLSELETELAGLLYQKNTESGEQISRTVSSVVSDTPQIELLKKTINTLELQLAAVLMEKRANHPEAQVLSRQIMDAKKELQAETEKYRMGRIQQLEQLQAELKREVAHFKTTARDLEEYQRELAAMEKHLKGVDGDIKAQQALLSKMPEKSYGQSQLELTYDISQQLYSSLLEYLYQVGMAEAMTLSDLEVAVEALVPEPDNPKSPKMLLNAIMAILLGSFFGLGLGFFIDYYDDTIRGSEEARSLGVSILGMIPRLNGGFLYSVRNRVLAVLGKRGISRSKKNLDRFFIGNLDPKSSLSEAYRNIRNGLKFASLDSPLKSLVVVSALMNEGKTTTATNLAVSFCREGKRVLFIDVDLLKPSAHKVFNLTNTMGLTNLLTKSVEPDQVIKKTSVENLFFLGSGPMPPDPGRLIESDRMRHLLEELSRDYDILILDSPPVLVANDAVILAGYVDGVMAVMENQVLTRRALDRMNNKFEQAKIRLLGTVFNKSKISDDSYYYYEYGAKKNKGMKT